MTRKEYIEFHEKLCTYARELSERKNRDYTGSDGEDPFVNFRRVETLGIATTEQGLLTRLTDKFCRVVTFVKEGKLSVCNESVVDTLVDIINYSCLLSAWIVCKTKSTTGEISESERKRGE